MRTFAISRMLQSSMLVIDRLSQMPHDHNVLRETHASLDPWGFEGFLNHSVVSCSCEKRYLID